MARKFHPNYKENRDYYANLYQVTARTVSRYASMGYPLDDETACRLAIATKAPQLSAKGSSASPDSSPAPSGTGSEALGLGGAISRLQKAEREASEAYQSAVNAGDEVLAMARQRLWLSFAEQLRKVEQTSPEVADANKSVVPIADVSRELNSAFSRLRKGLDSLPQRVALELVGRDEIDIKERLARETAEIIGALYSCKFIGGSGDE